MFKHRFNPPDIKVILWTALIWIGSAFVYYRSIYGLIPSVLAGIYTYRVASVRVKEKHRQKLLGQFKNLIIAMQSALEAGKSMENSLFAANQDLKRMYGESTEICKALDVVQRRMELNVTLDEALQEFSEKMELEEIYDFVLVISTVKRTGGNAIKVIKDTVDKIVSEIELREEIEVIVAAKKMEQQIMIYMPSLIILFLRTSNRDFLNPLYGNPVGFILMTIALMVNIAADYLGKKIVKID